ncbi:hypothetical protein M758_10G067700 [Ceratodon purpureus]|nr:hypothetical protein M758_10G067700 [Ceratodon purpureus]
MIKFHCHSGQTQNSSKVKSLHTHQHRNPNSTKFHQIQPNSSKICNILCSSSQHKTLISKHSTASSLGYFYCQVPLQPPHLITKNLQVSEESETLGESHQVEST